MVSSAWRLLGVVAAGAVVAQAFHPAGSAIVGHRGRLPLRSHRRWVGRNAGEDASDEPFSLPPRSHAQRVAELVERDLIEAILTDENAAVRKLWDHWSIEEGPDARRRLVETDEMIAIGQLDQAVEKLEALATEFPAWAEPINRKATILYMQGEYDASIELCRRVIVLKPWHFGALSGLVMCQSRLGSISQVQESSSRAMPPPGQFSDSKGNTYEPRRAWVETMLREIDMRQQLGV